MFRIIFIIVVIYFVASSYHKIKEFVFGKKEVVQEKVEEAKIIGNAVGKVAKQRIEIAKQPKADDSKE